MSKIFRSANAGTRFKAKLLSPRARILAGCAGIAPLVTALLTKKLGDVGISVRPAERRSTQPASSLMGNAYPLARTVPRPVKLFKAAHSAVVPESSGIEPLLSWTERCEEAGDRPLRCYWWRDSQVARSILGDLQTGVNTLPYRW